MSFVCQASIRAVKKRYLSTSAHKVFSKVGPSFLPSARARTCVVDTLVFPHCSDSSIIRR